LKLLLLLILLPLLLLLLVVNELGGNLFVRNELTTLLLALLGRVALIFTVLFEFTEFTEFTELLLESVLAEVRLDVSYFRVVVEHYYYSFLYYLVQSTYFYSDHI
jgi:hypothetical protein